MLYLTGHVTFWNKRIPHIGLDGDVRCTVCVYPVSDTFVVPHLVCPGLWRLIVLLELFLKPEFFPRRHLAFTAKKTKEVEPHLLCGCPLSLCISTFLCEKLLETKIKDTSRGALAGVKFQVTNGRKRRV